jgi:anti-sigma factor RsiW
MTQRDDRDPGAKITCQELVEVITDYIEGTLPDDDRARFDAHLELCDGCRIYLDQMRQTIAAVGRLSEESLDPRTREELVQAFRGWKGV